MFVKVFEQILDSSIANNYELRHFFEDLLKLADKTGAVDMTPEAIGRRINLPLEKVLVFLKELGEPDLSSRSPKEEGRRIMPLAADRSWGWFIINYEHYRDIRDQEARRSYNREAQKKWREANGKKTKKVRRVSTLEPLPGELMHGVAANNGASDERLSEIVTESLPGGLR